MTSLAVKRTEKQSFKEQARKDMNLHRTIKQYRLSKGMTQHTLAKKTKVRNSTISRLENGGILNPSLKVLVSLAEEMNITLDELVFGETDKDSK